MQEIKLSKTEINVAVGEGDISYVTMYPATAPDKGEIWHSSDDGVATVDYEGYIVGVSEGECVVTVTSRDNPSVKAEIKVKVTDKNKVREIKLSKYEINVAVGSGDISMVTMLPETAKDKREIWRSSDDAVATVDYEGYIVGVSEGECVVTVTSVNNPSVKAEIKVTVTDKNKVRDIKLSKYEINIPVGGGDISMVTMLPETAKDKREIWYSSDESVAIVDNEGYVIGVSEGKCEVTVVSVNNHDVKAVIQVTVGSGTTSSTTTTTTTTTTSTTNTTSTTTTTTTHIVQVIDGVTYIDGILLVNKEYALPEDYNPGMMKNCSLQFSKMVAAAAEDGIELYMSSGFRSYDYQSAIYNNYVSVYGAEEADRFSAKPGHSEHQSGLAIDVNIIDQSFAGTPEAKWLAENAHRFGFIIRYPEGKEDITGYMYEPWHIRYLGVHTANAVYESGLTLEEYLGVNVQTW